VIAKVVDNVAATWSTDVLPRGSSTFVDGGARGDAACGYSGVDSDSAGGAFVASATTSCHRIQLLYRRLGGRIDVARSAAFAAPLVQVGLAVGGNGEAAVGDVYGAFRPGRVAIELGHIGRLGAPHLLATTPYVANTSLYGPVVGRGGKVTVAWMQCGGRQLGCSIGAARGSATGRFGRVYTLASTPRINSAAISAQIGDGVVALQRCRSHGGGCSTSGCPGGRCSISVGTAGTDDSLTKPRLLTGDGRLDQLAGDAHGDQLIAWTDHSAIVWPRSRPRGPAASAHRTESRERQRGPGTSSPASARATKRSSAGCRAAR
jgi:hypothetical protein